MMMENNPQPQGVVSPMVQQKLQLINLRVTDLLQSLNDVVKALLEENKQLRTKIEMLKTPPGKAASDELVA
jgi:hypothetical protein